jgi:hypothetical protein
MGKAGNLMGVSMVALVMGPRHLRGQGITIGGLAGGLGTLAAPRDLGFIWVLVFESRGLRYILGEPQSRSCWCLGSPMASWGVLAPKGSGSPGGRQLGGKASGAWGHLGSL